MFRFLGALLRWVFSRGAAILLLWVVVLGATAVYLAGEHYFSGLPEQRELREAELLRYRAELAEIEQQMQEFDQSLKNRLRGAEQEIRKQRAAMAERADRIREVEAQLEKLSGFLAGARALWMRVTGEDPEKARSALASRLREEQEQREAEKAELARREGEGRAVRESMGAEERRLADRKAGVSERVGLAEREMDRLDREITRWETRKAAAFYWLGGAFRKAGKPLVFATVGILLFPLVGRACLYYLWAPLAARGRPVVIQTDAHAPIRVSDTAVAQEIVLEPGESAVIQHRFYQASDEDLSKRTQFVLDWRYPLTSLACWLVLLTRVTNRSSQHLRRLTLSSQDEAQIEMAVVEVPEGGSLICRPSFLAAAVVPGGKPPEIRSHWRLRSLHAWITLQFRYFEFRGPVRLVLWAYRGVRAERLTPENVVQRNERRTNQLATIGFTPSLRYRSRRAETFISYLRSQNPLFDDLFSGQGVFLCQQISRGDQFRQQGRFWAAVWNGVTKVFGI